MSHQRLRALRASAVTTALAAGLLAVLPVAPATAAAPALAQPAQLGVPSTAETGGITIENSFVSAQGWVKPDDEYPSRIILTSTNLAPTPATVTLTAPAGTDFLGASGPGTHPVTADSITWTATVPAEGTQTLVVEQQADSLAESPELVWRDLSTSAVLTVAATPTDPVLSHGPKVIPPGESYETARYGDRPFPVVPGRLQRPRLPGHPRARPRHRDQRPGSSRARRSTSTRRCRSASSTRTAPSRPTGVADGRLRRVPAPSFDFTPRELPGDTCTGGLTFADSPVPVHGHPGSTRSGSQDGVYQLPGNTAYYGADSNGYGDRLAPASAPAASTPAAAAPASSSTTRRSIADPEIDYSDYDTDKDGVVDFFMAVFAGCGGNGASQLTVVGCAYTDAPYDNVWPHSSSLEFYYTDPDTGLPGYTTDDQLKDLEGRPLWYTDDTYAETTTTDTGDALKVFVRVGPYNVNPETAIDKASVISHEYGHSLGLPDFYSTRQPRDLRRLEPDGHRQVAEHGRVLARRSSAGSCRRCSSPAARSDVDGWTDSKEDTDTIEWQRPDGTPYTLTEGDDGRVQQLRDVRRQAAGPAAARPGRVRQRRHREQDARLVVGVRQRLRLRADRRAQPRPRDPRAGHGGPGQRR